MTESAPLASVDEVRQIEAKTYRDSRGVLVPIQGSRDIPFPIFRVFYVQVGRQATVRGEHAHRLCQQALFCPVGSVEVTIDDGTREKKVVLREPAAGLYIPPSLWSSQKYLSHSSLLIVLSDLPFDERDYIRTYEDFLNYRGIDQKRAANF